MKIKIAGEEYLQKAAELSEDDAERILSRMGGKLPKRLEKDKISQLEAVAIQLEYEDEQLREWRERMLSINAEQKKVK